VCKLVRREAGTSTVELALVLPILILFAVGILDVARAMNAYVVVGSASQEGARYAVVHPTAAPSAIASATRERVAPLDPAALTVTLTYYDNATATFVPWPSAGIPASSPATTGVLVHVEISYPWSAVSAIAGTFFSGTGSATIRSGALMETRR